MNVGNIIDETSWPEQIAYRTFDNDLRYVSYETGFGRADLNNRGKCIAVH
jgi:hypothetical protein